MSDEAPEIHHEESGSGGRWFMALEGGEPEMTYRHLDARTISIDHTGVPPRFEGRGYGSALVRQGIADALVRGWRIVPACPFVAVLFRRHPEWADVLAE